MPSKSLHIFENEKVPNAIMKLVLPTIAGQVILVVYNMADTFFIGLAGNDALQTGVMICTPAFMVLSAIANLFGVGGSSMIAALLGEKKKAEAARASAISFYACLLTTALYSLLVFFFHHQAADLLGGTGPNVHEAAVRYLLITVALGGIVTSLSMEAGHLMRAEGHAMIAGTGVCLGGVLNILLDPLFMFVLLPKGHEAEGAAYATALSNLVSFAYFFVCYAGILKRGSVLSLKISRKIFDRALFRQILMIGLPAFLMTFLENLSYAVLDKKMSFYGVSVQTGLGVAKKINMLAHSVVRGITQGTLPLVAFNFGAGKRERTQKIMIHTLVIAFSAAVLCMAVIMFFARPFTEFFIRSGSGAETFGIKYLRIFAVGAPLSAIAYTAISFFQAVEKPREAIVVTVLRKGSVDIPLMFLLGPFFGDAGPVLATPVSDVICCAVALILLFQLSRKAVAARDAIVQRGETNDRSQDSDIDCGRRDRQFYQSRRETVADTACGQYAHPPAGGGTWRTHF